MTASHKVKRRHKSSIIAHPSLDVGHGISWELYQMIHVQAQRRPSSRQSSTDSVTNMDPETGVSLGWVGMRVGKGFAKIDIIYALKMTGRNLLSSLFNLHQTTIYILRSLPCKLARAVCNAIKRWKKITNLKYNFYYDFGKLTIKTIIMFTLYIITIII